jgi:23S rRNA pseudouridine2604 synthase
MESKALVRLSKLMAERGICSRREADELIALGHVYVDGLRVKELGTKVSPDVRIELSEEAKRELSKLVTVLLNKPIGYVSAQPEKDYEPAIVLLTKENYAGEGPPPFEPRSLQGLAVAGRLDIDSQGLLVFTQDGKVAKTLIGENSPVEKEYLVRVAGELPPDKLKLLRHGLELDGVKLKPAQVEWVNEDQLRFVLTEGRKRQVRRMCEAVGLRVLGLKRVRVGAVRLGNLPEGKWRFLSPGESFTQTKAPTPKASRPSRGGREISESKRGTPQGRKFPRR